MTIDGKAEKQNLLLKEHLSGKSYRTLEDDYRYTSKTICSLTNSVTKTLIHGNELTKLMKPLAYCGIMLLDGKVLPVKLLEEETLAMRVKGGGLIPNSRKRWKVRKSLTLIPFIDYETHDIPVYIIASSENGYELEQGFRELKAMGYDLKILVCDESMAETAQVAGKVYPGVIIQTCLTHYSRAMDRELRIDGVKRTMKAIQNKLDAIGKDILIPTRHYALQRAVKLTNQLGSLEYEYGYLIQFQSAMQDIFWSVTAEAELNEAEDRMNELISRMDLLHYPHADRIRRRYLDYYRKRDQITAFVRYPDLRIPKTTNLIEGFNSTVIELRLGSIRGFETEESARNYVNAMILRYRFHKFKCCREPFKHLNRKSPLEIASPLHNFNLRSKDWVELCRELKLKTP